MKWVVRIGALLAPTFIGIAWWLLLSGSDATTAAPPLFPIDEWRQELVGENIEERPTEIRLFEVGSDVAPRFAAQAGLFSFDWKTTYGGFQISTPQGSIYIDSGIDRETSQIMAQSPETSVFNQAEYEVLLSGMETAQHILLTHAHGDHVMAIARHPRPRAIAKHLRLNAPQKRALSSFFERGVLPKAYSELPLFFNGSLKKLAPGVLVIPAPGHTPGSQVVFVTLQNGREFLLIGDIVWTISNISDLKIRPQLTQVFVFDPNENRSIIKQQVRALHDLSNDDPELVLLPAHDRDYLLGLVDSGVIALGIRE